MSDCFENTAFVCLREIVSQKPVVSRTGLMATLFVLRESLNVFLSQDSYMTFEDISALINLFFVFVFRPEGLESLTLSFQIFA